MTNPITLDKRVWAHLERGSRGNPHCNSHPFLEANNEYCSFVYDNSTQRIEAYLKIENQDTSHYKLLTNRSIV